MEYFPEDEVEDEKEEVDDNVGEGKVDELPEDGDFEEREGFDFLRRESTFETCWLVAGEFVSDEAVDIEVRELLEWLCRDCRPWW